MTTTYRRKATAIEPTTAPDSALRLAASSPVSPLSAEPNGRLHAPRIGENPANTGDRTATGHVRWVVFQRTPRARFRLTQWLFAADKQAAKATAEAWYAGCQGTLEVMSYVEYQMVLDDLDALSRTRVAPAEPGQRRPNMKRGVSFGACVWCGAITSARGGRAPKYCATHRERKFQRAYRTGAPVIGSIPRTLPTEYEASRRQVVGA